MGANDGTGFSDAARGAHVDVLWSHVYVWAVAVENVKMALDDLLRRDGVVTSGAFAEALGVTRQAAHRRLAAEVESGRLIAEGEGRARRYRRPSFRFPIRGSAEDRIFQEVESAVPEFASLSPTERSILAYAFGEMVNNALDHSRGTFVSVEVRITADVIVLIVEDDGIGAFASVRAGRDLSTDVEAAAEITKGKVTTMPSRHSGEGIFFTSRATDRFSLSANGISLVVDTGLDDMAVLEESPRVGTRVECILKRPVTRTLKSVFEAFTDDLEFTRTRTVVKLFGIGRDFVSRSEARRLLHGLESFREIVIDFVSVPGIGQGFADEIFRVFANAHPTIRLVPVNMNEAVAFFVTRAERARSE